jgi:hypothetical protein
MFTPRAVQGKATTVEDSLALDAAALARDGAFRNGAGGETRWLDQAGRELGTVAWCVMAKSAVIKFHLHFVVRGHDEIVEQVAAVDHTFPPVGGCRWWFRCPGDAARAECGKRVAKLYLPPGGRRFACRHCWRLTYRSTQLHNSRRDRLRSDPLALLVELRRPRPSLAALQVALEGVR